MSPPRPLDPRFAHERMLRREDRRGEPSLWSETSSEGMIATAHYLATAAGVEAFERGGNAVDAALAASLALGVVEPAGSGLGGMAMALVLWAESGTTRFVEGACRAPRRATPEAVAAARRYRGHRAVAVPTYAKTIGYLHRRYGTIPFAELCAPAIAYAREGFPVSVVQHRTTRHYRRQLRRGSGARFFLDDGEAPPVGSWLRQPVLAATLERLAAAGVDDVYRGVIARRIVADMRANGGFVDADDLESLGDPRDVEPLRWSDGERVVASAGPPGGGLALLQMLHLASVLGEPIDPDTPEGVVLVASIVAQARRDRKAYRLRIGATELGEAAELLDRARAEATVRALRRRARLGETSHIAAMDRWGNVVSLTQSIERSFGAAEAAPDLGFLYNGYLRGFKVRNRRHPHFLRPGAPARSNASPTIVFRGGPWAALGSTGSERMASGLFSTLLRLERETPFSAVHGPRLHATPDDRVLWEEERFPPGCREALLRAGFRLDDLGPYSFKVGGLQLVVREDGRMTGVAEPRRDGAAGGPRTA